VLYRSQNNSLSGRVELGVARDGHGMRRPCKKAGFLKTMAKLKKAFGDQAGEARGAMGINEKVTGLEGLQGGIKYRERRTLPWGATGGMRGRLLN